MGTGGGLPGLPMAIFYPEVQFTLIDGTGKKIKAVHDMALRLGLDNVRAFHVRAEEVREGVISAAVQRGNVIYIPRPRPLVARACLFRWWL